VQYLPVLVTCVFSSCCSVRCSLSTDCDVSVQCQCQWVLSHGKRSQQSRCIACSNLTACADAAATQAGRYSSADKICYHSVYIVCSASGAFLVSVHYINPFFTYLPCTLRVEKHVDTKFLSIATPNTESLF